MLRKVILAFAILVVGVVPAQARDGDERRGGHEPSGQRVQSFHHFGGRFIPSTFFSYSFYSYPYYIYFYPSPVYSPPTVAEQSPTVYQPSPAQREVIFPNGKYVLAGDGVTDAYHWVWIPAVPEMPPAPPTAPPATPPAPPTASPPVSADATSPRPPQQLYRWIDAEGVANWTNNWEAVPAKYRSQAQGSL